MSGENIIVEGWKRLRARGHGRRRALLWMHLGYPNLRRAWASRAETWARYHELRRLGFSHEEAMKQSAKQYKTNPALMAAKQPTCRMNCATCGHTWSQPAGVFERQSDAGRFFGLPSPPGMLGITFPDEGGLRELKLMTLSCRTLSPYAHQTLTKPFSLPSAVDLSHLANEDLARITGRKP
jgi:hypothetical protein